MAKEGRKAVLERTLIETLARHDFHRRYYEFYEAARGRAEMRGARRDVLEQELAATGYTFTYNKKEDSFDHEESLNGRFVSVHVKDQGSVAALFLNVGEGPDVAGGAFSILALKAARLSDPAFRHDPPYPTIPFSTRQQLQDVISFALGVFERVKAEFAERRD